MLRQSLQRGYFYIYRSILEVLPINNQVQTESFVRVDISFSHPPGSFTIMAHYLAGERRKHFASDNIPPNHNFSRSAALNHPNFWKNYLESADALRLITELGWPIPPLFEDTLIRAFTNLTGTTPSIVEHTLCAILRALGEHLSTPLYAECCVQLCLKHSDALLAIAERQANESIKVDKNIHLTVSAFVLNVMTNCPSFVEVMQKPGWIVCLKSNFSLTEARTSQKR